MTTISLQNFMNICFLFHELNCNVCNGKDSSQYFKIHISKPYLPNPGVFPGKTDTFPCLEDEQALHSITFKCSSSLPGVAPLILRKEAC